MENEDQSESSLLVLVLDIGLSRATTLRNDPALAAQVLEAVIAFSNAHLMMKLKNQLALVACDTETTEWIYPEDKKSDLAELRQQDGQHELFNELERTVRRKIAELLKRSAGATGKGESMLSGALGRALCYIHRLQHEERRVNARVLVVTANGQSVSQYMNFMNVFFTSQKLGVLIDVCCLGPESSLLQQGCDITGGQYFRAPQPQGLLQYLLWVFLPEPLLRNKLALPPRVKVDYRAACFCHRELVDIGFVCSVCLSIVCKFSPICTTCHTVFKAPGALPVKPKRKKPKLA
ncbi:general transcription factor IIH subunit 3 [Neocloeon triangulifer]|uniref:general transcription factor IIH subunit 3 n=1 Tax=Neocloeon triangulifer TaxID=2078957 RepID=UPI00286EBAA4|nr:general transcription factor IIH subunit 3 [Neocloeon triangulifer]